MSFPPHRRFVKPLCGGFFIQVPFILFHLRLSLCLQASSVPFSNLFKPYKPSLFLTFPVFFRIEEKGLVAWNRDA